MHLSDQLKHHIKVFDIKTRKRLKESQMKLYHRMESLIQNKDKQFQKDLSKLDTLSPLKVLQRGYTLIEKDGQIIKKAESLKKGDFIDILFTDDKKTAEIK